MHIVHITPELAPLAKTGSVGDVLLGLCRELSWKGHDIDILLPKYDCMDSDSIRDLTIETEALMSYFDGKWYPNTIWRGWVENLKVYFIDPHHPSHFFHRGCIYGCDDDTLRYLYFSRCCLEFLYKSGITPDVIHLHDWQTAAIAPLFRDLYQPNGYTTPKTLLTIHNVDYQGICDPSEIEKIGLSSKKHITPESMQDPIQQTKVNLIKGGVIHSHGITTVSPSYAKEICSISNGKGLEELLCTNKHKLQGIINGIDYSYWNPEIDPHIPTHFSFREMPESPKDHHTLDKKAFVKKKLREKFGLDEQHRPLVGCVTHLIPQKGLELIKHSLYRTLELKGQFVLLGTSPIPSIDAEFHELKKKFLNHPHVSLKIVHSEELAHLIFAASDLFIVPSLSEPSGLVQLIALKYGSIPIVRRTGGLADTIFDVDHSSLPPEKRNGFTFDAPNTTGVNSALDRAIHCWFTEPDRWRKLMIQGMQMDYSWGKPSSKYIDLYLKLTNLL